MNEELLWNYIISKDPNVLNETCVKLTLRKDKQIKELAEEINSLTKRTKILKSALIDLSNSKRLPKKTLKVIEQMLDIIELMLMK